MRMGGGEFRVERYRSLEQTLRLRVRLAGEEALLPQTLQIKVIGLRILGLAMRDPALRSVNLSTCVGIAAYEAFRQTGSVTKSQ